MSLDTSNWITVIGIVLASIFALLGLLKIQNSKKYKIDATQKSGPFSKSKQKQTISINNTDD